MPSQMSANMPGTLIEIAGRVMDDEQRLKKRVGHMRMADDSIVDERFLRSSALEIGPMAAVEARAMAVQLLKRRRWISERMWSMNPEP